MEGLAKKIFNLSKLLLMWELGGCIYYTIEILYRGHSHISMFILGGLCLVLIGLINEVFSFSMYFELQVLIGDIVVLLGEFITGYIVNIKLGLAVWDYSNMPGNIMGQICPQFALLWIPIIAVAIIVDDWIRWKYLYEEQPRYKLFFKKK